jgi:tetratricopeptide (TPR) repeat protein
MSGLLVRGLAVTGIVLLSSMAALARQLPRAAATDEGRGPARAASLRVQGLEHGYNLDYPEALAAFREAIAADSEDSTNERLAAATIWMRLLFEQGAVTVDDYLGQARANIPRRKPSPDLIAAFRHHLDRATTLAEQHLRRNQRDADAHFQLGAAAALQASYVATVEGRVRDSIGAARRAYSAHERCLDLDPSRADAGLTVGLYRYAISSLSLPLRLLARLAGFGSGHASGLRLVEAAAAQSSDAQTNALFTLVLIYNREGRYAEAAQIVERLQRQYPRNRLLWLEAAGTALRAGRAADALRLLDLAAAQLTWDARPRAYGEDSRWQSLRDAARASIAKGGRS